MKLWTIQHINVWNKIKGKGSYKCDKRFICFSDFKEPYAWMISEAKNQVEGWTEDRAVWFWTKKPDLRTHKTIMDPTRPDKELHVLIEIEVDPKEVLFTDFDLWHLVLGKSYVPKNDKDWDRFEKSLPRKHKFSGFHKLPKKFQKEIERSWKRSVVKPDHKEMTQAIKQDIKKEEVVSTREFWIKNVVKKPKSS